MCPEIPDGTVGVCVNECSSDDDCDAPGHMCCSNGCGHVCMESVPGNLETDNKTNVGPIYIRVM